MIGRLFCALGFHEWGPWRMPRLVGAPPILGEVRLLGIMRIRQCARCKDTDWL